MWRNSALAKEINELHDIYLDEEAKAKQSIRVRENDI